MPSGRALRHREQDWLAPRLKATGVLCELLLAWQFPAALGLEDEMQSLGLDLDVGAARARDRLLQQERRDLALLDAGTEGAGQESSDEALAVGQGPAEAVCDVVLLVAKQIENGGDGPSMEEQLGHAQTSLRVAADPGIRTNGTNQAALRSQRELHDCRTTAASALNVCIRVVARIRARRAAHDPTGPASVLLIGHARCAPVLDLLGEPFSGHKACDSACSARGLDSEDLAPGLRLLSPACCGVRGACGQQQGQRRGEG
jgi:hypothetical protein